MIYKSGKEGPEFITEEKALRELEEKERQELKEGKKVNINESTYEPLKKIDE